MFKPLLREEVRTRCPHRVIVCCCSDFLHSSIWLGNRCSRHPGQIPIRPLIQLAGGQNQRLDLGRARRAARGQEADRA
jgi:hypothetical protein